MTSEHDSLADALRAHGRHRADRVAFTWLGDLTHPAGRLTYAEADAAAARVGARLEESTAPGDRVLLVHPPGLGFVTAFLGCLYAGRVPVPVYPVLDSVTGAQTVGRIVADSGAALAWTSDETMADLARRVLDIPAEWRPADGPLARPVPVDPAAPAFLQYTSGSTGAPKGVVVTHRGLVANLRSIASAFDHDESAVVLSWLPAYHDMGLIGNLLHPLHAGIPAYLAAPKDFVRNPVAWLRAIGELGVTTSGAPNFAYDLVIRSLERAPVEGLDLSGWRKAYSGAEPVSAGTLDRFAELLAPAGFRREAFIPCYGLAEATLLVTAVPPGTGARTRASADGTEVVSCGVPYGCEVAVVDGDSPVADGEVGEILVSGPSVGAGYWGRPDPTGAVFGAAVAGRAESWLRTGDLGFLVDGELHVTGRVKDVIVVRGRNLYPQDLERVATETVPTLRAGGVVAFADPTGRGVVIVGEARGRGLGPDDRRRLTVAITAEFGVTLVDVVGVRPGTVPRTTSGKLRRGETARRYRDGDYGARDAGNGPVDAGTGPTTAGADPKAVDADPAVAGAAGRESASGVRQAVETALDTPIPLETEPLVSYGMDSLTALHVSEVIFRRFGVDVPVRDLLEGLSLADVTARVVDRPAGTATQATGPGRAAPPAGGPTHGRLSKAQESLAFLQMLNPDSDEYNISFAWQLDPATDVDAFHAALRAAVRRQPELAVRIVADGNLRRREPVPAHRMTEALNLVPVPVRDDRLEEQLGYAATVPFRLDEGPLLRLHRWQSPDRQVYQLVVHHAVTDLWSLSVALRDLGHGYAELRAGRTPPAAPRGSYDEYVTAQEEYLAGPDAADRDRQLAERLPNRAGSLDVRTDGARGSRRSARAGRVERVVPVADPGAGPARVALLSALWAACLHRYGTPNPVVVGVPVVGRPSGRLAEVGGLCTNTVPLAVEVRPEQRLTDLVDDVRRQLVAGLDAGLYPLVRAVEAVRPRRAAGRLPLVETLITVQENPLPQVPGLLDAISGRASRLDLDGLTLRVVPVPRDSCRYDLDLVVTPRDGGYLLTLDHATDLFLPRTAEAILATYAAMVRAADSAAPTVVDDVLVLSPADEDLTRALGGCDTPPLDPPALARIRSVAAERPDAPALVEAGRTIDFAEFVARMDQVGGALRAALAPERTTGGAR
ncbi:Acyl-CoA synthetase (AMP-forming)/AMP-acid ligase II [Micromonospora nigra]|uniref:Acyl-CoA synthetase (AMP-forming)/AMP-acid ligase II n=1 Tax=Micromonospora nigra TaxID=145857 RepID=A0A1C6RBS7_9ACTN|nr:AMP-binding protein [Micromonospora nigra]SCL14606.1 Acyl-CoA synthetase (AMP-forming)/AMP-acid ligase II [Micromonospora nigra]